MHTALALLLAAVVNADTPADRLITDPTDVRAVTFGARAVPFDPAAAGMVDGFELGLRSRLFEEDPSDKTLTDWAVAAVLPLGKSFALTGDYEWLKLPGVDFDRGSLGAAVRMGKSASFGIAYRHFQTQSGPDDDASTWDLSLLVAPASFLSLGLGVDQMNQPHFLGKRLHRAWRAGAGVRPFGGSVALTLGADTRFDISDDGLDLDQARFLIDAGITSGVHIVAAFAPDSNLWVGARISLLDLELQGAVGGSVDDGSGFGENGSWAVTLRTHPAESLLTITGRTVEMPLSGNLTGRGDGIFGKSEAISTAALRLDQLADDSSVGHVILSIGDLDVSLATVEELRASIYRLRDAGKKVTAHLVGGTEKEYLVAAAADRVILDPASPLVLDGFAVTLVYFADALSKIGIRFDSVEVGRFKTGADELTRSKSRPEQQQMVGELLRQSYRLLAGSLARDRGLSGDEVLRLIRRGFVTPAEAIDLKLVDELSQPTDPHALPRLREVGEAISVEPKPTPRWGELPVIKVVAVTGTITSEAAGVVLPGEAAVAQNIVQQLEEARRDHNVRAVVLRVDSPGGEVFASELIWRAVRLLVNEKPVVVSMGEVAASGGYYIAAPASAIIAEPSTITGSIGIFALKPDLSGLLSLTGINAETYKIGPYADWRSVTRGLTEEERATLLLELQDEYKTFTERVADGRGIPVDTVLELAQGRVYTGERAAELGLVDGIGGLADAIREATALAELSPNAETRIDIPEKPFSLGALVGNMARANATAVGAVADWVRRVERLDRKALALLPFDVEVRP